VSVRDPQKSDLRVLFCRNSFSGFGSGETKKMRVGSCVLHHSYYRICGFGSGCASCAVGSGYMCGWRVLLVAGVGRERVLFSSMYVTIIKACSLIMLLPNEFINEFFFPK